MSFKYLDNFYMRARFPHACKTVSDVLRDTYIKRDETKVGHEASSQDLSNLEAIQWRYHYPVRFLSSFGRGRFGCCTQNYY